MNRDEIHQGNVPHFGFSFIVFLAPQHEDMLGVDSDYVIYAVDGHILRGDDIEWSKTGLDDRHPGLCFILGDLLNIILYWDCITFVCLVDKNGIIG